MPMTELCLRQDYFYNRTTSYAGLHIGQDYAYDCTTSSTRLCIRQDHLKKGNKSEKMRKDEKVYLREEDIGTKIVCKVANHVHPAHICICRSPCLLCRVCSPNCGSLYDVADQRYQWGLLVICLLGWVVRSLRKNPLSLRI